MLSENQIRSLACLYEDNEYFIELTESKFNLFTAKIMTSSNWSSKEDFHGNLILSR